MPIPPPPPNLYEYTEPVVAQLRTAGDKARQTLKSYLPSGPHAHLWNPQKTTAITAPGLNGHSVTVSKRSQFDSKLPAAFRAEVVLPSWVTPEVWLETFYWRRKEWDPSIDPRTNFIWTERNEEGTQGTTVTIDVTKPAAGGIISSRYLLNVSRYAFENEDLFLFCGTANSFSEDAVVKALEPKIGSLKSLVKATLHDSGSVLERTADGGWKYYYFIHVSLNGWLPTSVVEATMVSQMTQYIQDWLVWTQERFGAK